MLALKFDVKGFIRKFHVCKSSMELWDDVLERFGITNGPLIYQLLHELVNVNQGNFGVNMYINHLKKLRDEISCLCAIPESNCGCCVCGPNSKLMEIENRNKHL